MRGDEVADEVGGVPPRAVRGANRDEGGSARSAGATPLRGDRALAEAEFASTTRQALTTGSRMLVWSEAAHVKTARTLYRR